MLTAEEKKIQEKNLALIKAELKKANASVDQINYCEQKLKSHPKFLTLNFAPADFIDYGIHKNGVLLIAAAVQYTPLLIAQGYTYEQIANVGLMVSGDFRLESLSKYSAYLEKLGFSKEQILQIVSGNSGVNAINAIVVSYDKLKALKLNIDHIVEIATYDSGIRSVATVYYNADALAGKHSSEILDAVYSKKHRSANIVEPNHINPAYIKTIAKAAADKLEEIRMAASNTVSVTLPTNASNNNASQEVTQCTSFTTEEIAAAVSQELVDLRLSPSNFEKQLKSLMPYLVDLWNLPISEKNMAAIVRLKDPEIIAKALIFYTRIFLKYGYTIKEIFEIITHDEGVDTLEVLEKNYTLLTRSLGFNKSQILKMANQGRGWLNLLAVIDSQDTLFTTLALSKDDIVDIVGRYNGNENLNALLKYYNLIASLGFTHDEIIDIATFNHAKTCFETLIVCSPEIMKYEIPRVQLIDLISSPDGTKNLFWLYFQLKTLAPQDRNAEIVKTKMTELMAGTLSAEIEFPENYVTTIRRLADARLADFSKVQVPMTSTEAATTTRLFQKSKSTFFTGTKNKAPSLSTEQLAQQGSRQKTTQELATDFLQGKKNSLSSKSNENPVPKRQKATGRVPVHQQRQVNFVASSNLTLPPDIEKAFASQTVVYLPDSLSTEVRQFEEFASSAEPTEIVNDLQNMAQEPTQMLPELNIAPLNSTELEFPLLPGFDELCKQVAEIEKIDEAEKKSGFGC